MGEGGTIAGWSSAVNSTAAVTVYTDAGGAEYTGAALAANGGQNYLYAADFHNNKSTCSTRRSLSRRRRRELSFHDPNLRPDMRRSAFRRSPTAAAGRHRYTWRMHSKRRPDNSFASIGAGLGLVDVFDANGTFMIGLIAAGGALNAPWGIALAPADFGPLSNDLLVGNLGDGNQCLDWRAGN